MIIALGVGLGYLFSTVPNFELITSTVFIGGTLLGPKRGLLIGTVTEGLYSFLNPYGVAPPPIFIAQITAMGIAGLSGGFLSHKIYPDSAKKIIILGLLGLAFSFNFALLTTFAYAWSIGGSGNAIIISLIRGIHYYILHLVSNTLLFMILVPAVIKITLKFHLTPGAHA